MSRILVTGANGQVGRELLQALAPLGEVIAGDRTLLDLTCPAQICQVIGEMQPDVIVNAAAYTAVDQAESHVELTNAINGTAPCILAELAKASGATLIHLSTDYVFDGTKQTPYLENDLPIPLEPTLNRNGWVKLAFKACLASHRVTSSSGRPGSMVFMARQTL